MSRADCAPPPPYELNTMANANKTCFIPVPPLFVVDPYQHSLCPPERCGVYLRVEGNSAWSDSSIRAVPRPGHESAGSCPHHSNEWSEVPPIHHDMGHDSRARWWFWYSAGDPTRRVRRQMWTVGRLANTARNVNADARVPRQATCI